jgi:hypothetical protein
MRGFRRITQSVLGATFFVFDVFRATPAPADPSSLTGPPRGTFTLLTYNVAGLPILISQSEPLRNTPRIGELLNLYDVAVVQEDFAYHQALDARALHPHRSPPLVPDAKVGIGDGLNLYSRLPFTSFERVTWHKCNGHFADGSDCLAPKGFSVATEEVAPGLTLDLYDLHMDSGDSEGDVRARAEQAEQLLAFMQRRSAQHAVVVAGDTNMGTESEGVLRSFLRRAGLTDACRALSCARPELIDRVMYRGSAELTLRATQFSVDRRFVREDGKDLSDHEAIGVVLEWARENRVVESKPADTPVAPGARPPPKPTRGKG